MLFLNIPVSGTLKNCLKNINSDAACLAFLLVLSKMKRYFVNFILPSFAFMRWQLSGSFTCYFFNLNISQSDKKQSYEL